MSVLVLKLKEIKLEHYGTKGESSTSWKAKRHGDIKEAHHSLSIKASSCSSNNNGPKENG